MQSIRAEKMREIQNFGVKTLKVFNFGNTKKNLKCLKKIVFKFTNVLFFKFYFKCVFCFCFYSWQFSTAGYFYESDVIRFPPFILPCLTVV